MTKRSSTEISRALARARNSKEGKDWKRHVFQRDGGKCRICGAPAEVAHHNESFTKFPALRNKLDNGKSLCRDCDKRMHKDKVKKYKDGEGGPIVKKIIKKPVGGT